MKNQKPLKVFDFLFPDVMVLNEIIEQAAGRQGGEPEHGGKHLIFFSKSR